MLCWTRDIRDILHCLGGIQICFPLFLQLDQPLEQSIGELERKHLIEQTLGLIGDFLPTQEDVMFRSLGFSMVALLLKRFPQLLTPECVEIIADIQRKIKFKDLFY